MSTPPVVVPELDALKGQYLRHRDGTIWRVKATGRAGVTAYRAEGFGGRCYGLETVISWRALKHIYSVMVHAGDINTQTPR